jgi:hypothetical protein
VALSFASPLGASRLQQSTIYVPTDILAYYTKVRWHRGGREGVQFTGSGPKPKYHYGQKPGSIRHALPIPPFSSPVAQPKRGGDELMRTSGWIACPCVKVMV